MKLCKRRRVALTLLALLVVIVTLTSADEPEGNGLGDAEIAKLEAGDPELDSVIGVDLHDVKGRSSERVMRAAAAQDSRSFVVSVLMIVFSEIGDKTFFIAAIMAMRNSRFVVFGGAFASLAVMSAISAALGHAVPNLVPQPLVNYAAAVLFFVFGIGMLREGLRMRPDEAKQELEEVSAEIKEREDAGIGDAAEEGRAGRHSDDTTSFKEGLMNLCQFLCSPVFAQTFILTFLAEWGDRSQIATIALAAAQDVYFVTFGVILGHSLCTGLAVMGGGLLAEKISIRTVTISGGILFVLFGIIYLYEAHFSGTEGLPAQSSAFGQN